MKLKKLHLLPIRMVRRKKKQSSCKIPNRCKKRRQSIRRNLMHEKLITMQWQEYCVIHAKC